MNTGHILLFLAVFAGLTWLKEDWPWLANLPGDIRLSAGNVQVYLPLATALIASIITSIILRIIASRT